jgi:hypothetical protein
LQEAWSIGHREIIANCEFRNWEPARRVGVRRTIEEFRNQEI